MRLHIMKIHKSLTYVFFFLFINIVFSQQKQFKLDWKHGIPTTYQNKIIKTVYGFQPENFIYNDALKTVKFATSFPSTHYINEQNIIINSIQYTPISAEELKSYNTNLIDNNINIIAKNTTARNKKGVYLQFNPIVKQNGQFKKVITITVSFTQDNTFAQRNTATPPPTITNSVLADGQWYKFHINQTGVFKLNRNFFSSLGVDVNNVNPKNIRIFGNGGKAIPLANATVNEFDITENAIKFIGESDNTFDPSDYALFYAESAFGWDSVHQTNINPYHNKTYYYVNIGNNLGKRISNLIEPSGAATTNITKFHEYQFHEIDNLNIVHLGRQWFGEEFDINNNQSFIFNFPKIDISQPIKLKVITAAVAENNTFMNIANNNNNLGNINYSPINAFNLAQGGALSTDIITNNPEINIQLNYNNNGNPSANAYLDYISIEAVSNLTASNKQFIFQNNNVATLSGIGKYNINNTADVTEIWDITDKYNVVSKTNNGANNISFKANMGGIRKYIAVTSDYYIPEIDNTFVASTNLKGTVFLNENGIQEDIDYLIITPAIFKAQAETLAQINKQYNGLRVKVITLSDIYNEFNTGNQDIGAIRNFIRYVYKNAITTPLKYICFFGDASYDMKSRVTPNHNFVPSYHTFSGYSLISSYISDDYFGMLDDNEGTMLSSDKLDVAVGRIIASTTTEATQMVTKVRQYYEKESYGKWRNKMVIVSDDVDQAWEKILQQELDNLADIIVANHPFINMVKLHADSFAQQSSAGSELYPELTQSLLNNIELGSLAINYFGHGGEDGLGHERYFQKNHSASVTNICRYNTFITITCEYTRFDNPNRLTAGEALYQNPTGGAISLLTTTREIYTFAGIDINERLNKYLFDYANTGYVSNAEALRLAKNEISNDLRRVVFSIGDPALKLAIPKQEVRLTKINDVAITNPNVDVLEALDRVKITGEVVDANGNLLTNYNGLLSTVIFDKNQNRSTLGNDGTTDANGLIIMNYQTLGEKIFTGQATVTNGVFEFEFVVPRDILIPVGNGRISFYSKKENELIDQTGYNNTLKIGGLNANAPADNLPPEIFAWMNDESFVSGGTTNESPVLLLKLTDDNGINTASGIGHDITAILDGDEANPFVLNDYYETEPNDFTKGKVSYQFRDLETGLHTLTIKGWDTYNNSATTEIQFIVVNQNDELVLEKVLNYPNPFVNYTEFWFNHNSSSELNIMVQIYTVSGKLIKTIKGTSASSNKFDKTSLSRSISWDGRDDFGDKIGKGVYVYKLSVKDPSTNKTTVKFEKLVKL